jgi:hypothetical protein
MKQLYDRLLAYEPYKLQWWFCRIGHETFELAVFVPHWERCSDGSAEWGMKLSLLPLRE